MGCARRWWLFAAFAMPLLVLSSGCGSAQGYRVLKGGEVADGLSRYRSVAIEIRVVAGIELEDSRWRMFVAELEERVREAQVMPLVVRAPQPAESLLRVTVRKLETTEGGSLLEPKEFTSGEADVELIDARDQRAVAIFTVTASPTGFLPNTSSDGPKVATLRNVARAVASQLKRHR